MTSTASCGPILLSVTSCPLMTVTKQIDRRKYEGLVAFQGIAHVRSNRNTAHPRRSLTRHLSPGAGPARADAQTSQFFLQDVLQHQLVERKAGDQLLEPAVLFLELLQTAKLVDRQPTVLLLPVNKACSLAPIARHTAITGVPVSACLSACPICPSVKRLFRMASAPPPGARLCRIPNFITAPQNREDVEQTTSAVFVHGLDGAGLAFGRRSGRRV